MEPGTSQHAERQNDLPPYDGGRQDRRLALVVSVTLTDRHGGSLPGAKGLVLDGRYGWRWTFSGVDHTVLAGREVRHDPQRYHPRDIDFRKSTINF